MTKKLDSAPKSIIEFIPEEFGNTNTIEFHHQDKPNGENIQVKIRKNTEGKYYISWLRYIKNDDVWQETKKQGPLEDEEKVDTIWFMFLNEPDKFI